ncbi:hypothetical protein BDP27DRAFT_1450584 [Rhodocollybia butyracea]|uniref:Domain of unknown function at the cortex 1 domain-containing protein n=1 Tax=Rhodocollybia butyracea TaxID=206335 RepID=A0A9P5U3S0_9AGAR|nr:hypothetical protein BDP27DRAFT_1450584 [Rhodocollybia butyracea]
MPHLRVLAGPDPNHLVPITHLVNTNSPCKVSSELFEGQIIANIKGFNEDTEYFDRDDRRGVTWSIQVQGRFLQPHSADDILFGNTFEKPLHLPWGSGAALKFMNYIDPSLSHDLTSSTKPWALSPLIATMPYFAHSHNSKPPRFPSAHSLIDDNSQLPFCYDDDFDSPLSSASSSTSSLSSGSSGSFNSAHSHLSSHSKKSNSSNGLSSKIRAIPKLSRGSRGSHKASNPPVNLVTAAQRRSYFSDQEHRKRVVFGPEDIITTDFCYGFLEFAPSLTLRLPGGISFDLLRYWDGQPVRFMCCERKSSSSAPGSEPWGRSFWCVAIEMVD